MTKPNQWLNGFSKKITSQWGEDGIIEKILELIGDTNEWCVEFGAWDGIHYSNVCNLIKNKNYSTVLIEANSDRFQELVKTYESNRQVFPINAFVGFEKEDCLDALLNTTDIPVNFDLLSIDIDGNDYHVWESIKHYRPKVVVIEFNPTIPSTVEFVQPRDMRVAQGSSILSLDKLAKQKGYELVAVTHCNAIFVDSKYFGLFEIENNSVKEMRTDESVVTHIFQGFDGTVFLSGYGKLVWHETPYNLSKMQPLPKFLRKYPESYGKIKNFLFRTYRYLRKRNLV